MTSHSVPAWLLSPALPVAGVLHGMLFCLAISHITGFAWPPLVTRVLYGVLLVSAGVLVWQRRAAPAAWVAADTLLALFLVGALFSWVLYAQGESATVKYLQFIPFMVVLPYVLGRIMTPRDTVLLVRLLAWAGPLTIVLAVIDYAQYGEAIMIGSRVLFFGVAHGPLLISFALAGSLVASGYLLFTHGSTRGQKIALLLTQGMCIAALVLVAGRGGLLAALLGLSVLMALVRHVSALWKVGVMTYLAVVMIFSFFFLPSPQSELYARLLTNPGTVYHGTVRGMPVLSIEVAAEPILGDESCRPFQEGVNSVAMRWVLYREAVAMFQAVPWTGVGAAMFGRYSCVGVGGYPHSTILQAFAELGIVGGLLFAGLMATPVRNLRRQSNSGHRMAPFVMAMFAQSLLTDQLYGTYFMAAGTYFWVGTTASMRSSVAWEHSLDIQKNA